MWLTMFSHIRGFIVNLGDMLERWSNDLFRSIPFTCQCTSLRLQITLMFSIILAGASGSQVYFTSSCEPWNDSLFGGLPLLSLGLNWFGEIYSSISRFDLQNLVPHQLRR